MKDTECIERALDASAREALLALARRSIARGLAERRPARADPDAWSTALWQRAATFVTLEDGKGALRGCRGVLEAFRPLPADVAENAFASAFDDPRFAPVTEAEFDALRLSISVLTPKHALEVESRSALRDALVPGRDGLVVEAGRQRATFLPKVWEQLGDPEEFLTHLWHKAGLAASAWPEGIALWRYGALEFGEPHERPRAANAVG